jgi:hypothetical protein
MGKKLTAVKLAGYIANSTSIDEKLLLQDFLERHPKMKFYVGKLLNENDVLSGILLQEGNEILAEQIFESLRLEPCDINSRVKNYHPKQLKFFDY